MSASLNRSHAFVLENIVSLAVSFPLSQSRRPQILDADETPPDALLAAAVHLARAGHNAYYT